jgi:hypothetical membrane protein
VNVRLVRLFGYFGILAPVVGFSMIFLAIATAPWFSWTGNALSDLGVEGVTAVLFNSGLSMTAAVMMAFSLGLYELTRGSRVGTLSFLLMLAASGWLLGIGRFPETAGRIPFYFSVAFFATLPLALAAFTVYALRTGPRWLAYLTAACGLAAAVVWAPDWNAVAIPEALSALAVGIWSTATGLWMIRTTRDA